MKRKLLFAIVALMCSVGTWAQTDVTANYVGDVTFIIGSHEWKNNCTSTEHAQTASTAGAGYFNTQSFTNEVHTFKSNTDNVANGVESWSDNAKGEGYMLGRTIVLPNGQYTLKFTAMANNITNTVVKCGDTEQTFSAAEKYEEHTFSLTVTAANVTYNFGIYQKEGGAANWAVMGAITLTLNSSNVHPIPNNNNTGWSEDVEVNTWSKEGNSDGTTFFTPFLQKWVASGSTLANGTCQNSYTPSESGFYRVNAWVRLIKESGGQTTYSGATMFAGTNSVNVCSGGTLYNSNKVHLGTYSAKIDATKDVAFNYGFTLSGANFNWLSFKNITIEKITLDEFAETFSSGSAVTAGTWYKFTTGSSSDAYTLSSSGNATITYTTDGTITDDSGISTTWGLTAKQNVLLAPSTTYYIKSDAAVTITKTESSVSSSCVTGWTKVTSLSELQTNPEDYFFAIYSANNTGLMVETKSNGVPYYLTATSPSSTYYLYEIGNYTYNAESYFVMKSCSTSGYFHPVSDHAYDLQAPSSKSVADDACRLTFEVANNGIWNIKTWAVYDDGSYLGLWTPGNGYVDAERMAGNKTDAAKGSFLIYRIAKSNINLTGSITNPDFENATWDTGWSGTGTDKDKAFAKRSGNNSFSGNFAEMWVGKGSKMSAGNIYQTLSKLPAGVYTLSAKVQAGLPSKLYARIDAEEQYIECNSSVQTETLTFLVSETSDVTIGLKHDGVASASENVWVAVDDFALTYVEPLADSDDYDDLNLAIEAANAKTLGFEVDEYAPYNNVDAISKLASAKAINQSAVNAKSTITSATTALASATWTANVGKVNAVYNGDFSNSEVGSYATVKAVTGWDKVEGMRQVVTSTVEGSPLYDKHGIFVWGNNYVTYGNTLGYTMPLGANKIYRASYRRMSWEENSNRCGEIEIKNSKNETVAFFGTVTTTGDNNYAGDYNVADASSVTEAIYFVTGEEADTYTATLYSWGNAVFTDVELISVDALPLSESSTVYYAAGTYPSVTLTRTIAADKWSTFVVPFDIDNATLKAQFGDDVEVSEFSTNDKTGVTFTPMAEPAITANKPVLVRVSSAKSNFSFDGVTIVAGTPTISENGVNFVGNYDGDISIPNTLDTYFVKDNTIKKSTGTQRLKGFRAYFTVDAESPVKAFFENGIIFDNLATGIGFTPDSSLSKNGAEIFNLAGQKMSKLQKGVNIVNGKKVLVK